MSGTAGIERLAQRRLQKKKVMSSGTPMEKKRLPLTQKSSRRPAAAPGPMPRRRDAALRCGKKKEHVQEGSVGSEASPFAPGPSRRREQCCHLWVIDLVEGPTSHGVCKRCDEQRQFSNYLRPSGVLPEKDMSRLSHGPGLAVESLDTVLQKDTGGGVVATAAVGHRTKTWTYPKRGERWIRRQRSE